MMAGPGATTINMHQNQPHQVSIHKHLVNIKKLQIHPQLSKPSYETYCLSN